jgi:exodeoxyribonuclease VII small subunit
MSDPSPPPPNEPPPPAGPQPSPEGPAEGASYETSVARVEAIVRTLDAGGASLSETLELVREGRDLIEHCARELQAVGDALEELRLEDLVARLEGEGTGGRDTPSQSPTSPSPTSPSPTSPSPTQEGGAR